MNLSVCSLKVHPSDPGKNLRTVPSIVTLCCILICYDGGGNKIVSVDVTADVILSMALKKMDEIEHAQFGIIMYQSPMMPMMPKMLKLDTILTLTYYRNSIEHIKSASIVCSYF